MKDYQSYRTCFNNKTQFIVRINCGSYYVGSKAHKITDMINES